MASEPIFDELRLYSSQDFTIERVLSADCGSAQVFLVKDLEGNTYALKELNRRAVSGSEDATKLFQVVVQEAKELKALNHPAFPKVFGTYSHNDRGMVSKGIVMKYVPGKTLEEKIQRRVSIEESLDYIKQATKALDYLHNSGDRRKAHRDIKPSNIIIDEEGKVIILDLGSVTDKVDRTFGTSLRTVQGTLKYISLNQMSGNASPASDYYSLGLVLYELICGEINEFEFGKTHEKVNYNKFESRLQELGASKSRLISQVLKKMLLQEYNSGTELLADFEREASLELIVQSRNGWNIPNIEPKIFVRRSLESDATFLELRQGFASYLESNKDLLDPVHITLIQQIIKKLGDGIQPKTLINDVFRNFPQENIYGYSRETIWGLERAIFHNVPKSYDGKISYDSSFRKLFQKAVEKGVSIPDLTHFVHLIYEHSDQETKMGKTRIRELRRRIVSANLSTKVEEDYGLDQNDMRNRALARVLHEDHVIQAGLTRFANSDKSQSPFGTKDSTSPDPNIGSGAVLLSLVFAVPIGLLGLGPELSTGLVILSTIPSYGISSIIYNSFQRNKFNGVIGLTYDPQEVIASVSELLDYETNFGELEKRVKEKVKKDGIGSPIKLIRGITRDSKTAESHSRESYSLSNFISPGIIPIESKNTILEEKIIINKFEKEIPLNELINRTRP